MAYQPKSYRKFVATAATATLVASAVAPAAAAGFSDVSDRYAEAVNYLVENNITNGLTETTFGVQKEVKRGDAAVLLAKALGLDGEKSPASGFSDVPTRAQKAVNALKEAGIFNGKTAKTFGFEDSMTRGEMALVIAKAYELSGDVTLKFTDVGERYTQAVQALVENKITSGKTETSFGTSAKITRGEFAIFLHKAETLGESPEVVEIASVSAINKTTVKVVLNTEVDEVSADNFTIEGATVTAATLGEDKKTVTLAVSGLDYSKEYTVAVKAQVEGELLDFGSKAFTTPAVADLWELQIVPTASSLVADGADNTVVTFKLLNKATGQVDANADNIVLDLNTTYGTLASKRVTVQDGVATVLLTSEFSNTNLAAKIDAQIIEASGDYKELIGKVVGSTNVSFVTSTTENVETVTLVSAEANQADRVTLFFDKAVSLKHFVKTNIAGELLYKYYNGTQWISNVTADEIPKSITAENIRHELKLANSVLIEQGSNTNFVVKGFKPVSGNSKAIEVILEKSTVLKDNASVEIEVNTVNSLSKATKSTADFKVTDARIPEATSVTPEGLNTLKVKFSEAIADAKFQIDGRFAAPDAFTYSFGEFNPVSLVDNRDLATIKLVKGNGGKIGTDVNAGYDEDGIVDALQTNTTLSGYFTAGTHALQISSTEDFAKATDSNNVGSTQNLNFTIAGDTAKPAATVSVESPEQIRFSFDKTIGLSDTQFKALLGTSLKLQKLNTTTGEYADVTAGTTPGVEVFDYTDDFVVTKVSDSEYIVELTRDWTDIYNTTATSKNYYNDKYRFVIAKNAVTNVANGLKNDVINLDLNYSGSPLNTPDVTSPTINTIERVTAVSEKFEVTMSEPVKLVVGGTVKENVGVGSTLAQGQTTLANTTAQFIGKDKNGATVTFDAIVVGYADDDSADKVLEVKWNTTAQNNPQKIVDAGGSTDWTLVVRSLSDDVGNTAASATKAFKIEKSPATDTPFYVDYTENAGVKTYKVNGAGNGASADTVEVTFSEGVQYNGTFDATNPAQYTLNGKTLPIGTSIAIKDTNSDTTDGYEKIVITLPNGTLNLGATASNVITINKNLVSYDSSKIEGATEIVINVAENAQAADLATAQGYVNAATASYTKTTGKYALSTANGVSWTLKVGGSAVANGDNAPARTTSDQSVVLVASATVNGQTATKEYTVTIPAKTFSLVAGSGKVTIANDGTTSGTPTATQTAAVDGISLTLTPGADEVAFVATGSKVDAVTTGEITVSVTLDGVTKQFKVAVNADGTLGSITLL